MGKKIERIKPKRFYELKEGMVLARDLIDDNGLLLVAADIQLNKGLIDKIKEYDVGFVYIYEIEEVEDDEEIKELNLIESTIAKIDALVYNEVRELIRAKINELIKRRDYHEIIEQKLSEALNDQRVFEIVSTLKIMDNYTLKHTIDVAVLSLAIALELTMSKETTSILATSALIYDIGKKSTIFNIIDEQNELTEEDNSYIEMHPIESGRIVREKGFDEIIAQIVEQHHERYDGSGYPDGLKKNEINRLAMIIGLCDTYEALITDRPYRKAYTKIESVEFIFASGDYYYNYDIINALLRILDVFKVGTWVKLNTGEKGVIVKNNERFILRPIICVMYDKHNNKLENIREIDLENRENATIFIDKIL